MKTLGRMPVLFIGHGSPMNAVEQNDFTESLQRLGQSLSRPRAILCVSAHWMTEGTWVTHMEHPKTIHDFYGFPQELFDVQYPAPGAPAVAESVIEQVKTPRVWADDENWGLDHGAWSVLKHLYPDASVPTIQLSLNMAEDGEYHLKLGEQLRKLRDQGVLIVGSGNIVHNLRRIVWETTAKPYDWAVEFDQWSKQKILARDHDALANDFLKTHAGQLSVPTNDHYWPLLYAAAASDSADSIDFVFEGMQNASISMRAVAYGLQNVT